MRKVVAGLFMTLDGVVESPGTWQEHFDEDMGEAMMEQLTSQDAVLLGRDCLLPAPRRDWQVLLQCL